MENVGQERLPLYSLAHFDTAGKKEGELLVDGVTQRHAMLKTRVLRRRVVARSVELVVDVQDVAIDFAGSLVLLFRLLA